MCLCFLGLSCCFSTSHAYCLKFYILVAYLLLIINTFAGHFSKDPYLMETFFMKLAHPCQPQMSMRRNFQVQVSPISCGIETMFFPNHHLKYQLLKVMWHFQGQFTLCFCWIILGVELSNFSFSISLLVVMNVSCF